MAPSIPIRYYLDPYLQGQLILLKSQLQAQAQIRRQNYGKSKQIYSGRNKWSKIVAKQTTGMGAQLGPNPCSCYPAGAIYTTYGCFYLGNYGLPCF